MANPFDQFDEPNTANPFDKFDEAKKRDYALSEVPRAAGGNFTKSAGEFAHNLYHAVSHPVDTANAIVDLGAGAVRNGASYVLPKSAMDFMDQSPFGNPTAKQRSEQASSTASAFGGLLADRYGGLENVKRTFAEDPVGTAADLSAVLTGGGAAAGRLPGMAGRAGEVVAAAGNAVDPLQASMRGAGWAARKIAEPIVSNGLGTLTGTSAETVREAAKAGVNGNNTFTEHMRSPDKFGEVVDMARTGMGQLRDERSAAYNAGMATTRANQHLLDFNNVDAAATRAERIPFDKGRVISQEAADTLSDIRDKITEWKQNPTPNQVISPDGVSSPIFNASDFDSLKQAIGEIRSNTKEGTRARKVADEMYNAVKDEVLSVAPEYGHAMENYANASDQLGQLTKTFSLGEKASTDATLRKLQSILRNNVNTNYGARAGLAEELTQRQPNLMPALAGQMMSSGAPRGLAKVASIGEGGALLALHPHALPLLALTSPRLVGEAAYAAGRAAPTALDALRYAQTPALLAQQSGRQQRQLPGLLGGM